MSITPFEPDLSVLCLRLAKRLEDDGCEHAVEAAVALTVRGRRGLTSSALADHLGIDASVLVRVEAGELGVSAWPVELWQLVEADTPEFATLLRPSRSHPAGRNLRIARQG